VKHKIDCLLCCVHRMALISVPFIQWPQTECFFVSYNAICLFNKN
jgi:hypothetical protein